MSDLLIITGASRGIGLAAAELFVEMNYEVINLSRTPAPHEGVVNLEVDLAEATWVRDHGRAIKDAASGYERIVLVHNAGVLQKDTIRDLATGDFQRILQVNVIAPVQLNQLVLPLMRPGSSILYVGSTLSEQAVPGACSYVVSKHAVVGLMRATCQDLAGKEIHTACLCPGFTDTEMLREHVGGSAEVLRSIAAGMSFKRLIEPGEIARALLFCAENPVVNGAVIHANLGQIQD